MTRNCFLLLIANVFIVCESAIVEPNLLLTLSHITEDGDISGIYNITSIDANSSWPFDLHLKIRMFYIKTSIVKLRKSVEFLKVHSLSSSSIWTVKIEREIFSIDRATTHSKLSTKFFTDHEDIFGSCFTELQKMTAAFVMIKTSDKRRLSKNLRRDFYESIEVKFKILKTIEKEDESVWDKSDADIYHNFQEECNEIPMLSLAIIILVGSIVGTIILREIFIGIRESYIKFRDRNRVFPFTP